MDDLTNVDNLKRIQEELESIRNLPKIYGNILTCAENVVDSEAVNLSENIIALKLSIKALKSDVNKTNIL